MIVKDCGSRTAGERGGDPGKSRRTLTLLLGICLFGAALFPGLLQGQDPPPDLHYRTLHTPHLRITFPEGMETTASRAAERAEAAYTLLAESFLPPPSGPIDLLLTDHLDFANGSAQATPSNRIVIWIQPPIEGLDRSWFEEWLDSVILHEMAHIFHFDLTSLPGEVLRTLFGRVPRAWPYFPASALPDLLVEGVGVYVESIHTGTGRADGTFFEAMLRARWLESGAESLDQGLGPSPLWPGGDREYLFGALFLEHLREEYGDDSLLRFLRELGGAMIPYRLDAAARTAFGHSMGALWEDWSGEAMAEARELQARVEAENSPSVEQLTFTGGQSLYPAAGRGGVVAYHRVDNRSDPQIRLLTPSGDRQLVRWNPGWAPLRWEGESSLLLTQAEFVDSYRVYRDLYRVKSSGEVERLTRELRVQHADPHPEGDAIVAVLAEGEVNRLVLLSGGGEVSRTLREPEEGVLWSHPAWSPDGTRIAVARRRPGGWSAILILDREGRTLHLVTEEQSLQSLPTWGPGGSTLLWGSDRSGVPNLYGVTFGADGTPAELRQVTNLVTAGVFPSVDPEGSWIYFSLLTGEGWEVARLPYDPDSWRSAGPVDPRFEAAASPDDVDVEPTSLASDEVVVSDYSPLPTLLPRYWLPVRREEQGSGGDRILPAIWGISTSGADLLRRHRYSLSLLAPIRSPRERVEWVGRYTWAGLGNPLIVLDASGDWRVRGRIPVGGDPPTDTLVAVERERFLGGSLEFQRRRIRSSALLSIGGGRVTQERSLRTSEGEIAEGVSLILPHRSFGEVRISAGWSNARGYPLSISTERGISLSLGFRERRHLSLPSESRGVAGRDGSFREVVGVARGYLPIPLGAGANHVLALRVAGGSVEGPGGGGGHFALGGHSSLLPVRGYLQGAASAEAGWSLSGEWRFPIATLHRGIGPWPLYLDRLSGGAFLDLAGAFTSTDGIGNIGSAGVELVLSHSVLFDSLDRVRVGVAIPFLEGERVSGYIRSGWSF